MPAFPTGYSEPHTFPQLPHLNARKVTMAKEEKILREQLVELIKGGSAHITVEDALADFPAEKRALKPEGAPHNAWQLLEHTRFALHDLLDFSTNSHYLTPKWPDEYWPKDENPPSSDSWDEAIAGLKADLVEFEKLIGDPGTNLYATIPWGDGQNILREVLLAASHTSYHLGQIVFLKKQFEGALN
jgi:hypothetical protein